MYDIGGGGQKAFEKVPCDHGGKPGHARTDGGIFSDQAKPIWWLPREPFWRILIFQRKRSGAEKMRYALHALYRLSG